MSLNGTVWAPIGPSPIAQGASPERPCFCYRRQSNELQSSFTSVQPAWRVAQ